MDNEDGEISVNHDALISEISNRNYEDGERASSAGESREKIKEFLEVTGLHPKAFSAMRVGLKIKKESQKLDWLRSMEIMLPMVAAEIRGQSTQDMFDEDEQPAAEPVSEEEAEEYLGEPA